MPMVSASLLAVSGGALSWVLAYFVLICALAVGSVISARETARIPLRAGGCWFLNRRPFALDKVPSAHRLYPSPVTTTLSRRVP
jgi:hypothetical protein